MIRCPGYAYITRPLQNAHLPSFRPPTETFEGRPAQEENRSFGTLLFKSTLHPANRSAHKHARHEDRKTTDLACACEAKALKDGSIGREDSRTTWHACADLRTVVQKKRAALYIFYPHATGRPKRKNCRFAELGPYCFGRGQTGKGTRPGHCRPGRAAEEQIPQLNFSFFVTSWITSSVFGDG